MTLTQACNVATKLDIISLLTLFVYLLPTLGIDPSDHESARQNSDISFDYSIKLTLFLIVPRSWLAAAVSVAPDAGGTEEGARRARPQGQDGAPQPVRGRGLRGRPGGRRDQD